MEIARLTKVDNQRSQIEIEKEYQYLVRDHEVIKDQYAALLGRKEQIHLGDQAARGEFGHETVNQLPGQRRQHSDLTPTAQVVRVDGRLKETSDGSGPESVTLSGEVRFPGTYPIRRGETLYEVLQRAGGLTSRAFTKGSTFTRVELRQSEQRQLDLLTERMQRDLETLSVKAAADQASARQSLAAGRTLLAQLKASRAVGRLVIDLAAVMEGGKGSAKDVVLQDGDVLIVPAQP